MVIDAGAAVDDATNKYANISIIDYYWMDRRRLVKAMMPNLDERLSVKYPCVINVPLSGIKGMLMYAFTKGGDAKPAPD